VSLPNGQEYTFKYDPQYGLLNEIDYPNGGWIKYTWKLNDTASDFVSIPATYSGPPTYGFCNYEYQTPVVWTRTVGYTKGGSAALTQTFTYSTTWNNSVNPAQWTQKQTTVVTTDKVTGKTSNTIYTYYPTTVPTFAYAQNVFPPQIAAEHSVVTYDWGPSSSPILTVNKTWMDPYAMTGETRVLPSGQSSQTQYAYDFDDRVTDKYEFDFGQSSWSRWTHFAYYSTSPSVASPCQVIVYTSGSARAAEADAYYDGGTATCGSGKGATASIAGLPLASTANLPTHTNKTTAQALLCFVATLPRW
jgi:hypothetical protein